MGNCLSASPTTLSSNDFCPTTTLTYYEDSTGTAYNPVCEEPVIGTPDATQIGLSGFGSCFAYCENLYPSPAIVQFDQTSSTCQCFFTTASFTGYDTSYVYIPGGNDEIVALAAVLPPQVVLCTFPATTTTTSTTSTTSATSSTTTSSTTTTSTTSATSSTTTSSTTTTTPSTSSSTTASHFPTSVPYPAGNTTTTPHSAGASPYSGYYADSLTTLTSTYHGGGKYGGGDNHYPQYSYSYVAVTTSIVVYATSLEVITTSCAPKVTKCPPKTVTIIYTHTTNCPAANISTAAATISPSGWDSGYTGPYSNIAARSDISNSLSFASVAVMSLVFLLL